MTAAHQCLSGGSEYRYEADDAEPVAGRRYVVPAAAAEAFETAFRRHLPSQCRAQPDLLFQLVTLVSPTVLRRLGVPVFQALQRRGEFVITFPGVYHGGFNHGAPPGKDVSVEK